MIFVGIDVAKDKHDCFILNSEGTVLADVFTIANNRIGFETLLSRIQSCSFGRSDARMKPSGEPLRRSSHRSAAVRNGSPSRCLARTEIPCSTQKGKRF